MARKTGTLTFVGASGNNRAFAPGHPDYEQVKAWREAGIKPADIPAAWATYLASKGNANGTANNGNGAPATVATAKPLDALLAAGIETKDAMKASLDKLTAAQAEHDKNIAAHRAAVLALRAHPQGKSGLFSFRGTLYMATANGTFEPVEVTEIAEPAPVKPAAKGKKR